MNHDKDNDSAGATPTPLLFPLWLPQSPLRRGLKVALGRLALLASPGVGRRLENGEAPAGLVERMALAALIDRHQRAGTLESLSHLHRNFWAGDQAAGFYAATEDRFERVFLGQHRTVVEQLAKLVASGDFHTLCEVGCGGGQVLSHLQDQLPGLRRLVGLDLNASQIRLNQERYADQPRLEFVAGDAAEWIPAQIGPGWIVFAYGGVFEYFTQAQLGRLLSVIAAQAPASVGFVEPVAEDQALAADGPSQAFGTELSYSHPYLRLVEEAGFKVVCQEETRFGDSGLRAILQVART